METVLFLGGLFLGVALTALIVTVALFTIKDLKKITRPFKKKV